MTEEEIKDIEQELTELLTKVQPNLQDVIKRCFTNVTMQQNRNGETNEKDTLHDISYFAKNTQVNLSRLELVKTPTFHVQNLSLDLQSMNLSLRCSLGEVSLRGIYSAFNENLYNLIPIMAEGHVVVSLSNMSADVNVGLILEDDSYSFVNPNIDFTHDEVLVKLSWPSPNKCGGYDFNTTEQLAKYIDDLPLTASLSLPLFSLLRQKLQRHLAQVLRQATSVSEMVSCNPDIYEAYSGMVENLSRKGTRVIDMVLINMRRTLLQECHEVLELPPLHATFLHKVGSISYVCKFDTDTGWVKNLATVNRTNEVTTTKPDPMKTSLRVTLRIKDFQIGYDDYRIKWMGVSCGGRIAASFSTNYLHLAISVGLNQWEPYAQLDRLEFQHLDGADVHATGLGSLSSAARDPATAALRGAALCLASAKSSETLCRHAHRALAALPLWDIIHDK